MAWILVAQNQQVRERKVTVLLWPVVFTPDRDPAP